MGAWQGYWVAFVGIPAFIVTLAGMLIFRSATMVTFGNTQISPFPDTFRNIASGFANGILGGQGFDPFTLVLMAVGVAAFAVTQFRERLARQRYQQEVAGMPALVAKIAAVAVVAMAFAWQLAQYRGLPIVLVVLALLPLVYAAVTKGVLSAVAGSVFVARLNLANP